MNCDDWILDPLLKDIDKRKLLYIQKLFFESKNLSDKEKLPFFLALTARSKKEKIHFSDDETERIIQVLKKNCTNTELNQIDYILQQYKFSKK